MIIVIDCPSCENGVVKYTDTRIDPKVLPEHIQKHAYTKPVGVKEPIGANCDCPRVTKKLKRPCRNCNGRGEKSVSRAIPIKGDKVIVTDGDLLTQIFGEDVPAGPGTVYTTLMPEQQKLPLELPNGLAIYVTWDRVTKQGNFPKGKDGETWVFDIGELKLV
jgi:hypothetical protein